MVDNAKTPIQCAKLTVRRLWLAVAACAECCVGLADVPVIMPNAALVGYMNGRLNVEISSNDTVAAYTTATDYSGLDFSFQVRLKGSGDDAWVSVPGSVAPYLHGETSPDPAESEYSLAKRNRTLYWRGDAVLEGTYELRGCVSHGGDTSDWRAFPDFTAERSLSGAVKDSRKSLAFANKATDGDFGTYFEDYVTMPRWYGVVFDSPHLVTRLRLLPRADRCKGVSVVAADDDDFTVNVRTVLTLPDDATMTEHRIYDVPLGAGVVAKAIRVTRSAFAVPGDYPLGLIEHEWVGIRCPPEVNVAMCGVDDCRACLTASAAALADYSSVDVERAYQPEGPFERLATVADLSSGLCVTDTVSAVGLPCYYRLSVAAGGAVAVGGTGEAFTRGRFLQADEGVANLPSKVFVPEGRSVTINRTVANAFDGDVSTYVEAWYADDYEQAPISVGREFPEAARIFGACIYSRVMNAVYEMEKVGFYAAVDKQDYQNKNIVLLASKRAVPSYATWLWYPSTDTTNLYRCAFVAGDPVTTVWNYARELRFVGVTEGDEIASGKVFAPAGASVRGGACEAVVLWTGAVNAESYSVWRKEAGAEGWTKVSAELGPSVLEYTDATARAGMTYDYRVTATGLNGMMSASSDAGSAEIARRGFFILLR